MMKTHPSLAALCLLSLALPSHADLFTLKDGTTVEGKVISEAGDSYKLEVQVTKSIKDERTIPKADVVKRAGEQPDLKAFEAIAKFAPTPDLLSVDEYLTKIAAVEKFLKAHAISSKAKEAAAILATLKTESAQVAAGGIKLNGKMVSPEEYKANAYDLDARVMESKIRDLLKEEQPLAALRLFVEFDKEYPTTLSHGSLAPLIRQVIQNEVAGAKESLASLDARLKAREVGLQQMNAENRRASTEAIAEETALMETRFKAEKDAKQGWVTSSPFHKASLEETVTFGGVELARLAAIKTVLGADGGKAYRDLYNAIYSGADAAAVSTALAAAKTMKIPARYLAPLEAEAKDRK